MGVGENACVFFDDLPGVLVVLVLDARGFQSVKPDTGDCGIPKGKVFSYQREHTLQGTNISPQKWHFEDDFPFPVWWDMLIPWRVSHGVGVFSCFALRTITVVRPNKPSSLRLKKDLGYASKRMVIFQQRTPDCTACVNIGKPFSSFFQPFMCQQPSCSFERP